MSRKSKVLAGAVLVAAVVAGGSAFTASSGVPPTTLGYGSNTVSGATVNSIVYNTNATGDNVDSVSLVLVGDTTGKAVSIGFDGDPMTVCTAGDFDGTNTPYTCNGLTQSTETLTSTAVLVK